VVLALSAQGAEVSQIRVLDVVGGTLLPDALDGSYGPMAWTPDGRAFYYDSGQGGDPQGVAFHLDRKVRLHVLGAAGRDADVFSRAHDKDLGIAPEDFPAVSADPNLPKYLVGSLQTARREASLFLSPADGKGRWKALCKPGDQVVEVAFHGEDVYAVTFAGASRRKVVRTSIARPDWLHAEVVLPEGPDPITDLTASRDFLLVTCSDGIVSRVVKIDFRSGKASPVTLPAQGTAAVYCPDSAGNRFLVNLGSWVLPATLYDFDPAGDSFRGSAFSSRVAYPGLEALMSEEVEAVSHDGTKVPLSIVRRKDMPMDGSSCCILEGYGCYGYGIPARFSLLRTVAERGVVMAVAHVRGGGEKGEAWHLGGYKTTKPNTWKDFIACGEYLVKHGYTRPEHLAGTGTSAGGILISRAVTERPDLFAAAVCNVGDADAMRCEFGTDGPANAKEYGSVKDPVECLALYEMDGVQHVRPGVKYPAVLGVGGWNDPRVAPWQPGKFIAALQNATTSGKPVLMKVNYDDGHFTEDKSVTFRNFAGQYAFMLWQAGHKEFQPVP
jgi:prolyl oligopeptidase